MSDRLSELAESLEAVVLRLRPDEMSGELAESSCSSFARIERLASLAKALCAKRVADTGRYRHNGSRSPAHWLADKTGESMGGAIRSLETAKQAAQVPALDEVLRRGDLSATKAAEVAEATKADPTKAAELIKVASTATMGELKRRCEAIKAAARSEKDAQKAYGAIHARRYLRSWTEFDGAVRLDALFAPLDGAKVLAAIAAESRQHFELARRQGRREPAGAYGADALVSLLTDGDDLSSTNTDQLSAEAGREPAGALGDGRETGGGLFESSPARRPAPRRSRSASIAASEPTASLAPGAPGETSTSPTPLGGGKEPNHSRRSDQPSSLPGTEPAEVTITPPADKSRRPYRPRPSATVHLRVDLAASKRGRLHTGEVCEIPGVGPVPLATANEVLGDALVHLVVTDGVDVQSVVRLGRSVPSAARAALLERDPVCVVPGCDEARNLEIDHWREPFWKCRSTGLAGLCRICKSHHFLKTHKGFVLTGGPGNWTWLSPDDQKRQPSSAEPPALEGPA